MPPEAKRQLIAVIDNRTTMICLSAAGQIQPEGKPFETIAGAFWEPPFHVHCRTLVVPWMPGFVNEQRKAANAEIARRPLKRREREMVRFPPKAPHTLPVIRGGMDDVVSKEVRDLAAAVDDGSADLEDVPDLLRKDVIEASDRFQVSVNSNAGVRVSYWVTDQSDGTRWLLKAEDYEGVQQEILYSRLFAGMSDELPVPKVLFAGNTEDGGWVLIRHVGDEAGDGWDDLMRDGHALNWPNPVGDGPRQVVLSRFDPSRGPGRASYTQKLDVDDGDSVRLLISDWVTSDPDRHYGNVVWLRHGDLAHQLPVDHGLGYGGVTRWGHTLYDDVAEQRDRISNETLAHWLTVDRPSVFAKRIRSLTDDEGLARIAKSYDEMVRHLRRVDLDAIEDELRRVGALMDVADELGERSEWVMAQVRRRIDDLPPTREFFDLLDLTPASKAPAWMSGLSDSEPAQRLDEALQTWARLKDKSSDAAYHASEAIAKAKTALLHQRPSRLDDPPELLDLDHLARRLMESEDDAKLKDLWRAQTMSDWDEEFRGFGSPPARSTVRKLLQYEDELESGKLVNRGGYEAARVEFQRLTGAPWRSPASLPRLEDGLDELDAALTRHLAALPDERIPLRQQLREFEQRAGRPWRGPGDTGGRIDTFLRDQFRPRKVTVGLADDVIDDVDDAMVDVVSDEAGRLRSFFDAHDLDYPDTVRVGPADAWGQASTKWHSQIPGHQGENVVEIGDRFVSRNPGLADFAARRSAYHPDALIDFGMDEGERAVRSVVAHEHGHHVLFQLVDRLNGPEPTGRQLARWDEALKDWVPDPNRPLAGFPKAGYDQVRAVLADRLRPYSKTGYDFRTWLEAVSPQYAPSAYAESAFDEWFAECFEDVWMNDGRASPASVDTVEAVLEMLDELKAGVPRKKVGSASARASWWLFDDDGPGVPFA